MESFSKLFSEVFSAVKIFSEVFFSCIQVGIFSFYKSLKGGGGVKVLQSYIAVS